MASSLLSSACVIVVGPIYTAMDARVAPRSREEISASREGRDEGRRDAGSGGVSTLQGLLVSSRARVVEMKWDEAGKRRRRDRRIFTPDEEEEGRRGESVMREEEVIVVSVEQRFR